ncbi:MAG: ATP-binding protein [Alphaproteobacteria bacterium]|nr:ATP-binding protein [Alphaproteobacteria bacterium]
MATIHILCGFIAFGKTTLSKKLAKELPAVRFCSDELVRQLYDQKDNDEFMQGIQKVNALQWDWAKQIIENGIDVVMDFGPWTKQERKRVANMALSITPNVIFHSIVLDMEKARERLIKRNSEKQQYHVDLNFFDENSSQFEPISDDEGYTVKRYYQD